LIDGKVDGMRLLIGYDGSAHADQALNDLPYAGLGSSKPTQAVVLSAADLWPIRSHWTYEELTPEQRRKMALTEQLAYELSMDAMREAREHARAGADKLRSLRPDWDIEQRACPGPPAATLIKLAAEREADLIVLGSRGRSAIRGLLLGSVSRRVLAHAPCTVRVGRQLDARRTGGPARILVGLDGSEHALRAVRAVASRDWPRGTGVRVVTALDVHLITARCSVNAVGDEPRLCEPDVDARTWIGRIYDTLAEDLKTADLSADLVIREGDASTVLLREADDFAASAIFLGATGLRGWDQFVIGSVSTTVAEHARCSVEIVR
jgi:nucleotide-binding universal stress UspA family protein